MLSVSIRRFWHTVSASGARLLPSYWKEILLMPATPWNYNIIKHKITMLLSLYFPLGVISYVGAGTLKNFLMYPEQQCTNSTPSHKSFLVLSTSTSNIGWRGREYSFCLVAVIRLVLISVSLLLLDFASLCFYQTWVQNFYINLLMRFLWPGLLQLTLP